MAATPTTIEDVSVETGTGFKTGPVITVSAAHSVHDTYSAFLSPLLPLLIANLSLNKTAAGLLTVFYQGPSLLQPLIGHLGDRYNLRPLVILAPTIAAVLFTMIGLAPSYGLLVLLLVVAGFNSAGLHAVGPVLAGVLSGKRLGRGMSFWMVGGELGRTLGPLIAVAAVTALTPQGLPALIPGGMLASLIIYLNLRRVPDHRQQINTGADWRAGLAILQPILMPLAGVISTRAMLSIGLSTFLPTYLTESGASLWLAGVSLSVMEAAGVLGALFGGSLSDRLGRRRVLITMTISAPLVALGFLNLPNWAQMPLLLLVGLTLLSTTPVMMALVQERAPGSRALANGIFMAMNFVITSIAVIAVGFLADHFGLHMAYTISTLVMLAGLPFVFLLTAKGTEKP